MARRAEQTDDEILTRSIRVVRHHGPRVTLAVVGAELGLSSARLIQRFGSRDRFLAAVEDCADRRMLDAIVSDLDLGTDPLGALIDRLAAVAVRNARRLYFLSSSYLFDPGHLASEAGIREAKRRERLYLARFGEVLDAALGRGQLARGTDRARLARAISVTWIGTYASWAYAPVGSLGALVKRDLEFVVAPYRRLTASRRTRARRD